jgi:hypothetical protein
MKQSWLYDTETELGEEIKGTSKICIIWIIDFAGAVGSRLMLKSEQDKG